jgi:hypothetical protein
MRTPNASSFQFALTCWVPGSEDDAPVVWLGLDLLHHLFELVHPLSGVVGVHVLVARAKVAPLEAVHRAEVALLAVAQSALVKELSRAIAVPDVDVLVLQSARAGIARHEPQELLRNASPEDSLGGEQRQHTVPEGESHLHAKLGQSAGACPVASANTSADDITDESEVLLLWV